MSNPVASLFVGAMEEDWCRNSNLIKEDCLFSAVCCVSSNDLYNFDCGSSVATEDSGIQLFHAASATNTAETKNRDLRCLSDSSVTLDDPTTTLSTLEQHLSLEMPSIFDIKTEPRDDYPNGSFYAMASSFHIIYFGLNDL